MSYYILCIHIVHYTCIVGAYYILPIGKKYSMGEQEVNRYDGCHSLIWWGSEHTVETQNLIPTINHEGVHVVNIVQTTTSLFSTAHR